MTPLILFHLITGHYKLYPQIDKKGDYLSKIVRQIMRETEIVIDSNQNISERKANYLVIATAMQES